MNDQTETAIDRIPLTHSVRYVARGLPEVPNQYGPGVLAPSEITLTYRSASDCQLGRVHAYVAGRIWVDGSELPLLSGGLYGQHYDDGLDGWPAWLAEEARLHDPDAPPAAAGVAPAANQTDLGTEFVRQADQPDEAAIAAFEASLPEHTEPKADSKAERRDRYAAAMAKRDGDTWPTQYADDEADYRRRADAVMAVADAEQAELQGRLAHLQTTSEAAGILLARTTDHRDRFQAAIERVQGVLPFAEQVAATSGPGPASAVNAVLDRLRAALDGTEPAAASVVDQTEPDDTDLTEADIDRMMAASVPVQIVTAPPQTYAAAPAVDRAAVLREAADALGRMDYDADSNDYGYDTYRDAWNGGVMDGADLLRRLADEAQQQTAAADTGEEPTS